MAPKSFALLAALMCLWASTEMAQAVSSASSLPVEITMSEALEQALARNRDLVVSRSDVETARGRLQQARQYPFNPELNVQGDAGRGTGRGDTTGQRGIGGGSIGLSQVIEVRGQRGLRIRAAESEATKVEWLVRDTERDVVAATSKAFSDLRVAQERVGLAREAVELLAALKRTANELLEAGEVPQVDVLRADVEARRAANRLMVEQASTATANRALALVIGAPMNTVLHPEGPALFGPVVRSLDELLATARTNRPDLRAAVAAVDQAKAALRLIDAERFLPSVTLSASYGEANEFDATNRRILFGVSVPLPLWNRRSGDLQAAEGAVRKQEAQRDRILAQIDKEVAAAYETFVASRRVVDEYATAIIPTQERSAELIREGYRLGQFRLTEALLAQRDLIDVRTTYLDAVAAHNAVVVELQKAVGVRP